VNPWAFARIVGSGLRGRRLLGTVLFVAVVAIAAAGIVAGLESRRSATELWDRAFDEANAPHAILRAEDPAALAAPAADPRVIASSLTQEQGGELVRDGDDVEIVARSPVDGVTPTVGGPDVRRGSEAASSSEVAFEQSFADDLGVAIGDEVTFRVSDGSTVAFTVVGTVLDFQDCFYPQCDPGVVWITEDGMDRLGGAASFSSLVRLRVPAAAQAFTADILDRSGGSLLGAQDWLDTRSDALSVSQFFGAFLAAFGLVLLVAAGIVVAGSVTNRVFARRRDIGLLKAVGVTPRQVVGAIAFEHVALGAVGLVLGWLGAFAFTPSLRIGVTEVLAADRGLATAPFVLAAAAILTTVLVATLLPGARVARTSTAAALRPPHGGVRHSRVAGFAVATGAGPVVVGGLKDSFGRPLRSALAVSSIVLAVIALIITLGLDRAVDTTVHDPALTGDPWDVTVSTGDLDEDTVVAAIGATPGVDAWFSESEARRVVDGEVVLVRAVGGDPDAARYVIREGRAMQGAGEAMAGFGLLERLGKEVGDTVLVEVDDQTLPLTLVARYGETEDSGEVLLLRWESIEPLFPGAQPDTYRVVAEPGIDRAALADELVARLGPGASAQPLVVETDDLDAFTVAFWLVATLVLVVALANLGSTILLGVRERLRDFGVLRAIGFTPTQLIASTAVGTAALAVVAAVIGVPLGLVMSEGLQRGIGEAIGYGPELGTAPSAASVVVVVASVVVVATAIGALTCVHSARLSASELTRYE
jgi:putative ABC transport system permease protein